MGPILVFGHKNPDTDSVCSAVAYAHLKNLTDAEHVYLAARLGPVPLEAAWAFARFGVETPGEIEHVHTRVRDVMTPDPVTIETHESMLGAGRLMQERGVRALPVVERGVIRGLINQSILAERYIAETDLTGFRELPVRVSELVEVLNGELLAGDPDAVLSGGVLIGAMEPATMRGFIREGDTIIVGDRVRTQPMALEAGVACMVVSGGKRPDDDVLARADEGGAAVVLTSHDTYAAAKLANLCHRVGDLMDTGVPLIGPDMLLAEAAEDLLASPHREAVVVGAQGEAVGIVTRTNLARGQRRQVILVDHNELSQSAAGVENAEILEIVDHHRVGDVQTSGPILFLNLPVGATATIVARRYAEAGVQMPEPMAGLLLAAILSDTVLLKSPTTTDQDREEAKRLAGLLGVDAVEMGLEMFHARSAGEMFSAERALNADLKDYRAGDALIAIGQVETVDAADFMGHAGELRATMEQLREIRGYDLVLLLVTDVVREGSELLAVGRTRLAERALEVSLENGSAWLPGVLSRKKQVASRLMDAVGS